MKSRSFLPVHPRHAHSHTDHTHSHTHRPGEIPRAVCVSILVHYSITREREISHLSIIFNPDPILHLCFCTFPVQIQRTRGAKVPSRGRTLTADPSSLQQFAAVCGRCCNSTGEPMLSDSDVLPCAATSHDRLQHREYHTHPHSPAGGEGALCGWVVCCKIVQRERRVSLCTSTVSFRTDPRLFIFAAGAANLLLTCCKGANVIRVGTVVPALAVGVDPSLDHHHLRHHVERNRIGGVYLLAGRRECGGLPGSGVGARGIMKAAVSPLPAHSHRRTVPLFRDIPRYRVHVFRLSCAGRRTTNIRGAGLKKRIVVFIRVFTRSCGPLTPPPQRSSPRRTPPSPGDRGGAPASPPPASCPGG